MKDGLILVFSVLAVIAVLVLTYIASKYLATRVNNATSSANIRILERAALAQDKGLAVVEITQQYYLIGFSNNSIEILKELPDYHPAAPQPIGQNFLNILKDTMNHQKGTKADDQPENK